MTGIGNKATTRVIDFFSLRSQARGVPISMKIYKVAWSLASSLLLAGCIRLGRPHRAGFAAPVQPAYCAAYAARSFGLQLSAVILGAAGTALASTSPVSDDKTTIAILASSAAGLAALGATLAFLGAFYAAKYTRGCP